jgi:cytochrome d ubiquinol oxidase subunit I
LLKNREHIFARKSIIVASIFGLIFSLATVYTGDESAREVAKSQPMKFAAMEGLYQGGTNAPLVAAGIMVNDNESDAIHNKKKLIASVEIPNMLSYMIYLKGGEFIPGIHDLVHGNEAFGIMSASEKIERGTVAKNTLNNYKLAVKEGNTAKADSLKAQFYDPAFTKDYFKYFGYSYFTNPHDLVPNVPLNFYSFHIMVALGFWFILLFTLTLWLSLKNRIADWRWLLRAAIISMPLAYVASEAGWLVAEFGRQPWIIQDLMPTMAAASNLNSNMVQATFWIFFLTFTVLLIAEIKIMTKQIKQGPNHGGH